MFVIKESDETVTIANDKRFRPKIWQFRHWMLAHISAKQIPKDASKNNFPIFRLYLG